MSLDSELAESLREIFAIETGLFRAYGDALRAEDDRDARRHLLALQTSAAQNRGRLMAELERMEADYAGAGSEVTAALPALLEAETRQSALYQRIIQLGEEVGDPRLKTLGEEGAARQAEHRRVLEDLIERQA